MSEGAHPPARTTAKRRTPAAIVSIGDESEIAFRGLLEAAPDAMLVVNRGGRITLVNTQAEQLFGYSREQLLGEPIEMLVPPSVRAGHAGHRNQYFGEPQRRPMGSGLELAARRRDGTEFPVEISLSPVQTPGSTLVIAAVRDITERRRLEEIRREVAERRAAEAALARHAQELARSNEGLERRVQERNRELEAFTYSVSHDLRAPIRQIDGFARILDEQCAASLDEKGRHYLKRIQEGAVHMGHLVDDLLNLARVGRQDLRSRSVSLDAIVEQVREDLLPETTSREVCWKLGALPTTECDPGLMKVVFTNLLSNALKYTRTRQPASIEVGCTSQEGRPVIFIRDNGVGFDMKYASKLFGVFQRLHRADEFEGTGVGLATVQRIVHKHGGEIWAEAVPDHGATFSFTLSSPASAPAQP
jgi:PAS domain S-box-containing protein